MIPVPAPKWSANQWGTNRKPHNGYLGYVSERRVWHDVGGHIVLIDRENGGDWIDGSTRWLLLWEPAPGTDGAKSLGPRIVDCKTKTAAFALMRQAAAKDGQPEFSHFVNAEDLRVANVAK